MIFRSNKQEEAAGGPAQNFIQFLGLTFYGQKYLPSTGQAFPVEVGYSRTSY